MTIMDHFECTNCITLSKLSLLSLSALACIALLLAHCLSYVYLGHMIFGPRYAVFTHLDQCHV